MPKTQEAPPASAPTERVTLGRYLELAERGFLDRSEIHLLGAFAHAARKAGKRRQTVREWEADVEAFRRAPPA